MNNQKLIDRLYDVYIEETWPFQEACFVSNIKYSNIIKEYADQNGNKLSDYFASKSRKDTEQKVLKELMFAFEVLADGVNDFLYNCRKEEYERTYDKDYLLDDEYNFNKDYDFSCEQKDLFLINPNIIFNAYKLRGYKEITEKGFKQILKLITKIQKDKAVDKVIGNNINTMIFEDIVYRLFDFYNKDEGLFCTELTNDIMLNRAGELYDITCLSEKVEPSLTFDKYRSSLISKKLCNVDVDKLAFCRNLLEFYRTGIMPDQLGTIDNSTNGLDKKDLLKSFRRTYSSRYNDEEFKENQSNFVLDADRLEVPLLVDIEACKSVLKDNNLIIGMLLKGGLTPFNNDDEFLYLLHINIDDVSKEGSKYEIQYNAIPCSKLDSRIQLYRLDAFTKEAVHKNKSLKLKTTTHLHKYNHFDILRGKTSGKYDIADNIEEDVSTFEDSLDYFLSLLSLESDTLKSKIINKITAIINKEKENCKGISLS